MVSSEGKVNVQLLDYNLVVTSDLIHYLLGTVFLTMGVAIDQTMASIVSP